MFEELFHELEPYEQTKHEKIFLAQPREHNWENLGADLRAAELAIKRYDTKKILHILLKLVPELAKSTVTAVQEKPKVVAINRPG